MLQHSNTADSVEFVEHVLTVRYQSAVHVLSSLAMLLCIPSHIRRRLLALIAVTVCLVSATPNIIAQPLTTAQEIATHLTSKEAGPAPVLLEATVIFQDVGLTIFLSDDTGVTFIRAAKDNPKVHMGERLRITGMTYNGLIIGGIKPTSIERIGEGASVDPQEVTPDDLASGKFHYHWISISGVGRSLRRNGENSATLKLLAAGKMVEVRFDEAPPDARMLVDTELRVRGLAAGDINDRRQLVMPYVRVRNMEDVQILKAPSDDPFAMRFVSLAELQRASADAHRVKIQGVALGKAAGGLFLRDEERSVFVQTDAPDVKAGDRVEALGFPEMGVFSARLSDAECRVSGAGTAPAPVMAGLKELTNGCDAELITVEARVLRRLDQHGETELLAQSGTVNLTVFAPQEILPEVQTNSLVRITGLCRVTNARGDGYRAKPTAYNVWLRNDADLMLLQRAPWWTSQRLVFGLNVAAGIAVLAFAWVALLRRQVAKQLTVIEAKAQREAVAEERQRIAREFHDTLEQELAGLTLRLDAVASRVTDEKARGLLEQQRRLLVRLQAETRDFVWDLRDTSRADQPLPEALQALLDHQQAGTLIQMSLKCEGSVPMLPPLMQHHLLRITREAVHNAIKYSCAKSIAVSLDYQLDLLRLVIEDDGLGFNVASADALDGHFGIRGMRERVKKIGADLQLHSTLGKGTRVELTLALAAMKR